MTTRMISRAATSLLLMLLTTATAWAETESVSYIDENGNQQTVTATVLTGSTEEIELAAGWYVVKSDISYPRISNASSSSGTINIILADGSEMIVNCKNKIAIWLSSNTPLAIYGQSASTGRLTVSSDIIAITSGNLTINGGIVSATSKNSYNSAINANNANITINGGKVTATGGENAKGIDVSNESSTGTITLGLNKSTDFIRSNGYGGTVNIKSGKTLYDGATAYSGNNVSLPGSPVTLRPYSSNDFSQSGDEYTIHTAKGWGVFCDALLDNDTYNRFSGKTVHLDSDITVSCMAGAQDHEFCGKFDGGNHTLTFSYGTPGGYVSDEYTAPFRYVSTVTPDGGSEVPTNFRNLHVNGNIYTKAMYAAGLIAQHWGTVNIENCSSSVTINSEVKGDGYHAGFIAETLEGSTTNITNSVFDGSINFTGSGEKTKSCGGFIRRNNGIVNITNCLLDATFNIGANSSFTFTGTGVPNTEEHIVNSYYTTALGTAQGKKARSITAGDNVTIVAVSPVGEPVENGTSSVSGITVYAKGITRTVGQTTTFYYGSGDDVSLTLSTDREGYSCDYTASTGTLSGTANPYTLTMSDEDVIITAGSWKKLLTNTDITIADIPDQTYTGSPIGPEVTISDDEKTLVMNVDYTVEYSNNVNVGTATATITGMGDYAGTVEKTFNIVYHTVTTSYVEADGTLHENIEAIQLDATMTNLEGGTYVVNSNINYTSGITIDGNINLILADGCTMNVGTSGSRIDRRGINASVVTIYRQTNGTGALNVYTSGKDNDAINATILTINGGNITANTDGYNAGALVAGTHNVTINGGNIEATNVGSGGYAIYATGNFTYTGGNVTTSADGGIAIYARGQNYNFSWRNPDDHITIGSTGLYTDGATATFNKLFTDAEGNYYGGTSELTGTDINNLAGLTLSPCLALADNNDNSTVIDNNDGTTIAVALQGRTLYKDAKWNTLCLPFSIDDINAKDASDNFICPLHGATIKTLVSSSFADEELTMKFTEDKDNITAIEAGKPYIIKWANGDNITNPVFTGVTVSKATTNAETTYVDFIGTYAKKVWNAENTSDLFLGTGNKLYYPKPAHEDPNNEESEMVYPSIGACRAYFQLKNDLTAGDPTSTTVRAFNLNFGEEDEKTGITTTNYTNFTNSDDAWYDLSGRKLSGKPTKKGLYINNGRKIVIK